MNMANQTENSETLRQSLRQKLQFCPIIFQALNRKFYDSIESSMIQSTVKIKAKQKSRTYNQSPKREVYNPEKFSGKSVQLYNYVRNFLRIKSSKFFDSIAFGIMAKWSQKSEVKQKFRGKKNQCKPRGTNLPTEKISKSVRVFFFFFNSVQTFGTFKQQNFLSKTLTL